MFKERLLVQKQETKAETALYSCSCSLSGVWDVFRSFVILTSVSGNRCWKQVEETEVLVFRLELVSN